MSRVAPATFWEEPNAQAAATRAVLAYAAYADGAWFFSTDAAEQDGTFTLRGGEEFMDVGVVSGGRVALLGAQMTVAILTLPTSSALSFYSPGLSITAARTGSAAQLRTYGA